MPFEHNLIAPPPGPACCSGMAYYSTNAPRQHRHTRFDDEACLIHVAEDGQVGIILHDGSGRYSIIKFCPWCGAAVGPEADVRLAKEKALLEHGLQWRVLKTPPLTDADTEDEGGAPYHMTPGEQRVLNAALLRSHPARSHKKKTPARAKPALKAKKVWTEAEREEAARKSRAWHAERKRRQEAEARLAARRVELAEEAFDDLATAPGQDEADP